MEIVAVVHAKGESDRLYKKNLRKLGGKPLISYAIKNACDSKATKVIIDSDDDVILKVGSFLGAIPLKRPKELASNAVTGDDLAYWQASNFPKADVIVQVVPTSPFTKPKTINRCVDRVLQGVNSCFTANAERLYIWDRLPPENVMQPLYIHNGKILNSSDLHHTFVEYTGVYAFKPGYALDYKQRIDDFSYDTIPITPIEKIDINYEEDFELAELVWKGMNELKATEI
jgi:N-acylneuraminate cytidylyltransferase